MSVSRNMFWFRADLRVSDQHFSGELGYDYNGVFYYSDHTTNSFSSPLPPSRFRRDFLRQALSELEIRLNEWNCKLYKSALNPLDDIPRICISEGITEVTCSRGFSWFERWQEVQLKKLLDRIGVVLNVSDAERFPWMPEVALHPKSIFTDYRRKMEPLLVRGITDARQPPPSDVLQAAKHSLGNRNTEDSYCAVIGGESWAQLRINDFVRSGGGIERYVETRNGMLGYGYSSMLAPYLAIGCCSAAQVFDAVKIFELEYGSSKSSYWLIFELLWRSYFKWISEIHAHRIFVSSGYNGRNEPIGLKDRNKFRQWVRGETSEPIVNACMRELGHTGFMGNRARQIAASYLIHDLAVEWTWGARYFEHMLIDFDPCSNYGNWAYLAGVGSDSRPSRRFNPTLQQEKYDPMKLFVNHWMGWNAIEPEEEIFELITN